MSYGAVDDGGAQPIAHNHFGVQSLTGPKGKPNYKVTLTAEKAPVRLASGQEVNAWTFNGSAPGPELRIRQGDLVQVTLVNKDIGDGVTIHWHGLDVPNAEDGVAGVTQNAVEPGGRYVYRFRPEQVGTFWYHTHQDASEGVKQGLFGALVIDPKQRPRGLDLALPVHTFSGHTAIGTHDDAWRKAVRPGTPVRLRLINTDSASAKFQLSGMLPSVVAIDGAEIAPARVPPGEPIEIGAGGRYDIAFRMPTVSHPSRSKTPKPHSCSARMEPGTRPRLRQGRRSTRRLARGRRRSFRERTSTARSSSRSARRSAFSTAGRADTGR